MLIICYCFGVCLFSQFEFLCDLQIKQEDRKIEVRRVGAAPTVPIATRGDNLCIKVSVVRLEISCTCIHSIE